MPSVLINIADLPVYSYGVFLAVGCIILSYGFFSSCKKLFLPKEYGLTLSIIFCFGLLIFGKLFFLLPLKELFTSVDHSLQTYFQFGFFFPGGLICAVILVMVYLRLRRVPLMPFADSMTIYIMLAMAVGRIGCIHNGCCFDLDCSLFFLSGMDIFTNPYTTQPALKQIFLSGSSLIILVFILCFRKQWSLISGRMFSVFLISYAFTRMVSLVNDLLFFDAPLRLSPSLFMTMLLFLLGTFIFLKKV